MSTLETSPTPSPLRDLRGWQWAVGLGVVAVAYFLLQIDLGTDFFARRHTVGSVTGVQVWGVAALLALQAVFAMLRSRPVLTFTLIVISMFASLWLLPDRNAIVGVTLLFAVFNLTARRTSHTWLPLLGAAFLADLTLQIMTTVVELHAEVNVFVGITYATRALISYVVAVPPGLLVRAYRGQAELAAENAASREREHESALAATVSAERARMARELHDVAAYRFSEILIKTTAALQVLHTAPDSAAQLLESVRVQGDRTLTNLREVIGVLRDASAAEAETASLDNLSDLVESVRVVHPSVELTVSGQINDLPPSVSLACYRIMQESLTNAMRHAPGSRISVNVERGSRDMSISVRNSAPTHHLDPVASRGGGFGLRGMRERVTLLGGELTSESDGTGWLTRATIPLSLRSGTSLSLGSGT